VTLKPHGKRKYPDKTKKLVYDENYAIKKSLPFEQRFLIASRTDYFIFLLKLSPFFPEEKYAGIGRLIKEKLTKSVQNDYC